MILCIKPGNHLIVSFKEYIMEPKNTIKDIGITDILTTRKGIPEDYHCDCEYCTGNFLGELYHTESDNYYTQFTRNQYYFDKEADNSDKHICPGHWSGYRYAIQQFTNPGDMVFDPTVGTGTAIVESVNNGRDGVGIELEFATVTRRTVELQYRNQTTTGKGEVLEGDARNADSILSAAGYNGEFADLVVNGTPYPVLGGSQSDAPERKGKDGSKDGMIYYQNEQNVGVLKGKEYWNTINQIYSASIARLKSGGKFVTIIKDPTQNKKAYLLHKMVTDEVMKNNPVKYYGSYIHKHLPYTYFMRTYPKRFPEVRLPYYQTAIVLEKI